MSKFGRSESAWLQRRGVAVRTRLHTALAIDHRKANLGQLESLRRQRQQMLALDPHGLADRVRFARDPTLLVGATSCEQKLVQLFQTLHPRNRHQMIAPEVAHFAFHSALLVSSRRIAELRLKAPVRAEGNEPLSLLPLIPAQNLLHRTLQVVVAQPPKHPAEELKRELVCFQKRLLGGVIVGAMKRSASRHRAHREAIHLAQLAHDFRESFVPINLCLAAPVVALRHERLPFCHPQLLLATADVMTHGRFHHCKLGPFRTNPLPDACAVCRCLRGACWSARRISSMNSFTGSSLGCDRIGTLRSGGTALAIACRTIRRCTPNCFATPRIVPTPKRYSRLICSNSSTLRLLSIALPVPAGRDRVGRSIAIYKVGPN